MAEAAPPSRVALAYRVHWHVVFTHFPLSSFLAASLFMLLHVITDNNCYELASAICLELGVAAMPFTLLSGWLTWKKRFKGAATKTFLYKVWIGFAMLALSALLLFWRLAVVDPYADVAWHVAFAAGVFLLLLGAGAEGYYGGRLNHH